MSKAILVIDMPNSCKECSLLFRDEYSDWCPCKVKENITDIFEHIEKLNKPNWCPLKPAPEKDEIYYLHEWSAGYKKGWNDCVNYLVGE